MTVTSWKINPDWLWELSLEVFKTQIGEVNWSALSIHPAWGRILD